MFELDQDFSHFYLSPVLSHFLLNSRLKLLIFIYSSREYFT